jgi:hypothetical protein
VVYWRVVNDVSGAVERWAHSQSFHADSLTRGERAAVLTDVRALLAELRRLGELVRPVGEARADASAPTVFTALTADAEHIADPGASRLSRTERVAQWTAGLRHVAELVGRYVQGRAYAEHAGVVSQLDDGLRASVCAPDQGARAEDVALALHAALKALEALWHEATEPEVLDEIAGSRAALTHLTERIRAVYATNAGRQPVAEATSTPLWR